MASFILEHFNFVDGWPRLNQNYIDSMSPMEQALFRQSEEETIAGSKLQLADLCDNCHIRPQYAKTYLIYKKELEKLLHELRAQMDNPNKEISDLALGALISSTDAIVNRKIQLAALHFSTRWGEPIENWLPKGLGCLVGIFLLFTFLFTLILELV